MIQTFLNSLEDPNRPLIAPNYWLLVKFGLVLPKNMLGRAVYVVIHTLFAYFVFTQYFDLYFSRSNLDEILANLRISMMSAVVAAKVFSFLYYQKEWLKILNYVTESDKIERDTRDTVRGKILDKYTKYCRRATFLYCLISYMTVFGAVIDPLLTYTSSATFREGLRNGTELFPHMFKAWTPVDQYSFPGTWINVVWQGTCCVWGGASMGCYDSNVIVMLVFFGGKLDLIQERCRQIFGEDDRRISDEQAEKAIREMSQMHDAHLKHMRLLNSVLSPVMFMYVVLCSLMLCASTFQLTTAKNAVEMMPLTEFLIFGIAQLFVFCWHSNIVFLKNERLTQGLFESQWWTAKARQRKSLHILMGQMNQSHNFSAGPFTNLTMSTFITILKGAYSYYTLLRK